PVQIGNRMADVLGEWMGCLDEGIHPADVQESISQGTRHLVVDLDDDVLRALRRGQRGIDARAKTQVPVGVGRRTLQQADVDRQGPRREQALDLAQEDRRIVGAALLYGLAYIAADE